MQLLYQSELRHQPMAEVVPEFVTANGAQHDETVLWACELAQAASNVIAEADVVIQKYAIGWKIERINPIDKNLLRLGYYELKYSDTPVNVVLNEVIEIAKQFSTEESPKFINGILGSFVKNECLRES